MKAEIETPFFQRPKQRGWWERGRLGGLRGVIGENSRGAGTQGYEKTRQPDVLALKSCRNG